MTPPAVSGFSSREAHGRAVGGRPPGICVNRVGSMITFFFTGQPVTDYDSARRCETRRFGEFHRWMLERGVYLPPSQFEAAFVSAAHSEADIAHTVHAAREFFAR